MERGFYAQFTPPSAAGLTRGAGRRHRLFSHLPERIGTPPDLIPLCKSLSTGAADAGLALLWSA